MSFRIRCYTLFDITNTGVLNRSKPPADADETWLVKRNTQCNFDTILQVISLRSQPEVIKFPEKNNGKPKCFGSMVTTDYHWTFEFEIQHASVFENGVQPLGGLYTDCDGVPMIKIPENISSFLNTSDEMKNIHFEII